MDKSFKNDWIRNIMIDFGSSAVVITVSRFVNKIITFVKSKEVFSLVFPFVAFA